MENPKENLPSLADRDSYRNASDICCAAAFASIGLSILVWAFRRATANEGHAERLGIFIGLWAPTFLILSDRLEKYSERPPNVPKPQGDESPQLELEPLTSLNS